MPVHPKADFPQHIRFEKPDHTDFQKMREGKVRTAAMVAGVHSAKGIPADPAFEMFCVENGKNMTRRQASKWLRRKVG
jgi:hypothetical protein